MTEEEIIAALAQRRKELDLSFREVARRSGLSYVTIRNLEAGKNSPALYTLTRWATALSFNVELHPNLTAKVDR